MLMTFDLFFPVANDGLILTIYKALTWREYLLRGENTLSIDDNHK